MQPLLFQSNACVCSTLKPLKDDLEVSCLFVFTEVLTQNPSKSPNLAHTCHSSAKAIKPGSRPPAVSVKDSSWDDVSGHKKHFWCFSDAAGANRIAEAARRTGNEKKPEGKLEGVFMMCATLDGMSLLKLIKLMQRYCRKMWCLRKTSKGPEEKAFVGNENYI